jgi:uncharacterized integral membrane protein (TIGR00698 family)
VTDTGLKDAPARAPAASAIAAAVPGVLVSAGLATAAMALAALPVFRDALHWGPLLLVILLGMAWRSVAPLPAWAEAGVAVAQRPLLRWAVAGLGFRLGLGELLRIGAPALVVVLVSTTAALFFGWWIARRLRVDEDLGLLLGVGGAICGASAVIAADSVVQGNRRAAPLALGVITLLGTVGIVIYPPIARALGMSPFVYGVWDGATLHEMAQVVAAGFGLSDESARVATVVKLARICLLAPTVLLLGAIVRRRRGAAGHGAPVAVVPWFLVLFLVFVAVNSANVLPAAWTEAIRRADLWLLCVGMAGVGLQTSFADIARAGLRPLAAGISQWVFLAVVAYALAAWLC